MDTFERVQELRRHRRWNTAIGRTRLKQKIDKSRKRIAELGKLCDEQTVRDMEQERIDLKQFLEATRECTDIKELPLTLVNTLIKRIKIHDSIKDGNGVKHVPVDIYFTAVVIINIPDAEEILKVMEEIRTKPLRIT